MGKISSRLLDKKLEKHISGIFWKSVSDLKTPRDAEIFFKDILSPTERTMIIKRLAIALLLVREYTYDLIDDTLKVARPTIINVSFWMKN